MLVVGERSVRCSRCSNRCRFVVCSVRFSCVLVSVSSFLNFVLFRNKATCKGWILVLYLNTQPVGFVNVQLIFSQKRCDLKLHIYSSYDFSALSL